METKTRTRGLAVTEDEKIIEERGKIYGPVEPMWRAIGSMQWSNFTFLLQKCNSERRKPTIEEMAHLAAMNMVAVKMVRSIQAPGHKDSFADGRNYFTIGEKVSVGVSSL